MPKLKDLIDRLSLFFPVVKFTVQEHSMLPTFKPGDMVLVLRWFPVHRGQVVVARLGNRFIIKRVEEVENGKVRLMSDNPEAGPQDRTLPRKDLVGVVFFVKKAEEED